MIGTKLAHYEIGSHIGSGGMGDVYQATDTKLGRSVAIKFLPEAFSHDGERVARFQLEARVLASLNHANIAAIYGIEESDNRRFLVMELVDGATLADRIAQGPIGVEEALAIARQIADALEAAHEQGIIHRDLKPANIKVRPDGTVKVLDFGLAKAMEPAAGAAAGVSQSPTITSPAMTQAGVILGTAAYMSPEQAKGRPADKRSDVWAFAAVLYEMFTGKRAFPGEDVSDTLVAVLRDDPDWSALPPNTPVRIRQTLRVCLQRNPKQRAQDIGDVRLALEGAFETTVAAVSTAAVAGQSPAWRRAAMLVGSLMIGGVVAGAAIWIATRPAAPRVIRTTIETTGPTALSIMGFDRDLAVTPDGSRVVYRGAGQLLVRSLDQLEPTSNPLGNARGLFVSPDGQWIGFFDGGTSLKKVAMSGGPPVTLLNAPELIGPRGATWGENDTIIFATNGKGLQQIPAAGGDATVLTKLNPAAGEAGHVFPEFLPGAHAVLFTTVAAGGNLNNAQVAVLDLRNGMHKIIIRGGSNAHYVPSGHLVYAAAGTLRAVAFDLDRLEVIGAAVPVVPQVVASIYGSADFDVASNGTLVYVPGNSGFLSRRTLAWVDRQGRETPLKVPDRTYVYPRLSPDGTRVALSVRDQQDDIWVWDLTRETLTRMTFDPGADQYPAWTPDSKRLVFGSGTDVFSLAADGTGSPEPLTKSAPSPLYPYAVSPDGSRMVVREGVGSYDLDVLLLDNDRRIEPLIRTPFTELNAEISPDGRWLAYESNESGQRQIYVRPFPNISTGRWQVTGGGGTRPLWAKNGRELFYMTTDGPEATLMSVPIQPASTWSAGTPTKLFSGRFFFTETGVGEGRTYDVSPDGRRFLMIKEAGSANQPPASTSLVVVQNWFEELKRLVPTR
jgi:protein kinase-like protein/WD40 repeat protein